MGKVYNDTLSEITNKIVQQVREDQDRFIFETISPYIEETTKMVISKKILCRALQCFQEEHFEEYMSLKKKVRKYDEKTKRHCD